MEDGKIGRYENQTEQSEVKGVFCKYLTSCHVMHVHAAVFGEKHGTEQASRADLSFSSPC